MLPLKLAGKLGSESIAMFRIVLSVGRMYNEMAKLVSKKYRPEELLAIINCLEGCLDISGVDRTIAADLVIDLRKLGYKIVRIDDGKL
jgi:hypothetical protein